MNDTTTPNSPPLLTEEELSTLLQRKAAIQANLKAGGAVAGTCSTSSSSVACPGCGCGTGDKAPATEKSRLSKPALAVLVIAAVALLLWGV
ncbi:hypothetical protein [Giesbergeria anulus]|uniref:Uncharacterized protein n=1 Tax=Giesbergeria anulus TaxID=180197 RepID=A0A1H9DZX2_9BURK|nr:hypothetical protein [Giesbergeria anulus]SEQ18228.1 hypothetical protein SAMN02982919_00151 [Giesbergeria anulus]